MVHRQQTKVYHITYSRENGIGALFFWGCNFRCRICLLKKEAYDCHLPENRFRIYDPSYKSKNPDQFVSLEQLIRVLNPVSLSKVFLMGAEPLCDPILPEILTYLKQERRCSVTLLTNGYYEVPIAMLDEVVFSIKAVTPALHSDYTGKDNKTVLTSFEKLGKQKKVNLYAETVFIPDYVDEPEIMKIATFIALVDRSISFRIDAYLPISGLPWRAPEVSELEALRDNVKEILPNTTCLHGESGKKELAYEVERLF